MRITTQLGIVAALAGLAVAGWYYQDRLPVMLDENAARANRNEGGVRTVPVEIAPVSQRRIAVTVNAVGTARAFAAVTLTSKVAGIVEEILFDEGQWVAAGATLIRLDASELIADLAEARANLVNARQLHERAEKLFKTRNIAESRVEELVAQLASAEAAVRGQEAKLAEYTIRAPFEGRLGLANISVGALVRPGDPITTLDDTRVLKVDFDVPETAIARIARGQTIVASSPAFADRRFTGEVATVDSRVDPVTRAITIRAHLPNPDEIIRPGMFLTVALNVGVKENALLIPEEAVLASPAGQYVFAVEDGKAKRRSITIGQRLVGAIEVLDGLGAGDSVIVAGVQKVRDGTPIEAIRKAEPPGRAPAGE